DLDQLWTALGQLYPVGITVAELEEQSGSGRSGLTAEFLTEELTNDIHLAYDRRESELGEEVTRELERRVILSVLDRKWREHLYEMDYLRDGIGLRAMAQRDPLVEYQREGYELFTAMMDAIKEETVGYLFHVEVQAPPAVSDEAEEAAAAVTAAPTSAAVQAIAAAAKSAPAVTAKGLGPARPQVLEYSAPSADGGVMHETLQADGEEVELDPHASRAERRRAERAKRKRK
ncbi:MAG: preprotein translocase subunit SecA, partial [Candidatus Nanopelagicales bacterium]